MKEGRKLRGRKGERHPLLGRNDRRQVGIKVTMKEGGKEGGKAGKGKGGKARQRE